MAPVLFCRSEPARSTRLMSLFFWFCGFPVSSKKVCLKVTFVTVWAQELVAFMLVAPMVRFEVPFSICSSMSS